MKNNQILTYHSDKLVAIAAANPAALKLSSLALHKAKPPITGIRDRQTSQLVFSPINKYAKNTVKTGAELLTVSANDTGTYHNATKPRIRVENLKKRKMYKFT